MNAAKTASRRNLLSMLTLTKRIAKAIAKTIERINNTIERFSLSIQITIYLTLKVNHLFSDPLEPDRFLVTFGCPGTFYRMKFGYQNGIHYICKKK